LTKSKKTAKKKDTGSLLRLGKYLFKYWYLFVPAVILTALANHLGIMGPMYSGYAIDAVANASGVDFPVVYENLSKMAFCYIVSAILTYILAINMSYLAQKVLYTIRKQIFEKLTKLPVSYFDTHSTGDIISRITYDARTISNSIAHLLLNIMSNLYVILGSLIFMWRISKTLIIVFAVIIPISMIFAKYQSKMVRPLFKERSAKLGELNGYGEEMITGLRAVQAYSREEEMSRRFNKRNTDAMDAGYRANYHAHVIEPVMTFINNFALSLVMMLGGIFYLYSQNGTIAETSIFFITLGGVAKFVQYSRKFVGPIGSLGNILSELQSTFSAADRVFALLDEENEPADKENAPLLEDAKGKVDFEKVVFGYTDDKLILKGIDFSAMEGKTVAIVGPTGAGKTTIINLLMRFYDINSGKISVDGIEERDYNRSSLRKAYTMVLQDTWLFEGTIFENIAYGREDATLEEVKQAAKVAGIDRYIESLRDGYDTVLREGGLNISKGQRQLITIARAMISNSQMLILDEATSNVDSRTEMKIQKAMNELMKGRTCFVIAHRLSTIQNADLILVLQDGVITEQGSHEELLKKKGFYSTLYNSQFD